MSQPADTDHLAALIDRKFDILSGLRQLATRQAEITAGGDMTKLLTLLASKQRLLHNLQAVETQLDPFARRTLKLDDGVRPRIGSERATPPRGAKRC